MVLLAGFKVLLLSRTASGDICVATPMANRSRLSTEGIVGPLANTTILRTRIDESLSFREALGRVRTSVLDAHAAQELPFDVLASELAQRDDFDPASLLQVGFELQNSLRRSLTLAGVAVRPFGNTHREGQPRLPIDRTWLSLALNETLAGIVGSFVYKSDMFATTTVKRWVVDYKRILTSASKNPETPIGRLLEC